MSPRTVVMLRHVLVWFCTSFATVILHTQLTA
jgi:hypothetical protein